MSGSIGNPNNSGNTSEVAAKGVCIEPADLSKQSPISHGNQLQLLPPPPPQTFISPVEEQRRRCKLYCLLSDNASETELNDMVAVARNCLTQQGFLPINTPDENDAADEVTLQSRLQSNRYRLVFKRAYILIVLSVCPIFFNTLVTDYAVNPERLDRFAGDPMSDFSRDCEMYIVGKIKNADMFVARAYTKWTQEMNL